MIKNSTSNPASTAVPSATSKPANDTGSIMVQGFIKIFDPATQKVFVEKRA